VRRESQKLRNPLALWQGARLVAGPFGRGDGVSGAAEEADVQPFLRAAARACRLLVLLRTAPAALHFSPCSSLAGAIVIRNYKHRSTHAHSHYVQDRARPCVFGMVTKELKPRFR